MVYKLKPCGVLVYTHHRYICERLIYTECAYTIEVPECGAVWKHTALSGESLGDCPIPQRR